MTSGAAPRLLPQGCAILRGNGAGKVPQESSLAKGGRKEGGREVRQDGQDWRDEGGKVAGRGSHRGHREQKESGKRGEKRGSERGSTKEQKDKEKRECGKGAEGGGQGRARLRPRRQRRTKGGREAGSVCVFGLDGGGAARRPPRKTATGRDGRGKGAFFGGASRPGEPLSRIPHPPGSAGTLRPTFCRFVPPGRAERAPFPPSRPGPGRG